MMKDTTAAIRTQAGFSLTGLMMAMAITMVVGLSAVQLFVQNERVFRDQELVLEMNQSVRAVSSMLADELRMAGQGVPVYAARLAGAPTEATQSFVNGTAANTVRFRSSYRSARAEVQNVMPMTMTLGTSIVLTVDEVDNIDTLVGNATTRFVFLWGQSGTTWTWVRARITSINLGGDTLTVTPTQMSTAGGVFDWEPYLVLEEGLAYRLVSGDIQRASFGGFTVLATPLMAFQVVGENFTGLTFTYYDAAGNVVTPTALADRATIRRVDFTITAETSEELASTGVVGTYAVTMSVYPRNVAL
jgi:hypothetical protein